MSKGLEEMEGFAMKLFEGRVGVRMPHMERSKEPRVAE